MRKSPVLAVLLILCSCIQEIPIDMKGSTDKLVVSSIIYPDKLILINVGALKLFGDSVTPPPEILEITIKEDGILIDRPKGQGPQIYSSTYPKEGSSYELTVRSPYETLTAVTAIPVKVPITLAEFRMSDVLTQYGDALHEAKISWNDPPGSNFYELQLLGPFSFYQYDEIDDPVLLQEADLDYFPSTFVFSDKQFDGKTCTIKLRYAWSKKIYALLRNVSEEYYHYKKSWHRHIWLQNTSMNVDKIREDYNIFPLLFQGDPVPLYSNFDTGLGIFGGFSQDVRLLKQVK